VPIANGFGPQRIENGKSSIGPGSSASSCRITAARFVR
jgi:hypothetical protein